MHRCVRIFWTVLFLFCGSISFAKGGEKHHGQKPGTITSVKETTVTSLESLPNTSKGSQENTSTSSSSGGFNAPIIRAPSNAPSNNFDQGFFDSVQGLPKLEDSVIPPIRGAYDPPTDNGVIRLHSERGAYSPPTSNGVVRPGALSPYDPPTNNGVVRP